MTLISLLQSIAVLKRRRLISLFQALKMRDRVLVVFFLGVALTALLFWFVALYLSSTKPVPNYGGEYTEGMAAQPRYLNPLLSQTSEADADLVELLYCGLFGYDADGKLVNRLAESSAVSEDGKTYTIALKQGVQWHDGQEVTADDVLFTIRAIQDPAYKSPLRSNWLSVDVVAVDRYTLSFTLKKVYFGFLENLTVGILPKHIWEGIVPENFLLADYNLAPIGCGPFRFSSAEKDSSGNMRAIELHSFKEYYTGEPYISKVTFRFYPDEVSLLDAYKRKEILGIDTVTPEMLSQLVERKSTHLYEIAIPRIFAVFFNVTKNAALAQDEVRQALSLATDRELIIREVLKEKGQPAYTSFLPFMTGYVSNASFPTYDKDKAETLLDAAGWKRGDDGVRIKGGARLAFTLTTPDWPELVQTADLIKTEWQSVGVEINVNVLGAADLQQDIIRPREYEALLFGEAAMLDSDPYSFWHSSNKHDPGLNLALFDNKNADDVLSSLREEMDPVKRDDEYRTFQGILLQENPAVFLYSPTYLYVVSNVVKGVDIRSADTPASRLSNMKDWYIKTKRIRK